VVRASCAATDPARWTGSGTLEVSPEWSGGTSAAKRQHFRRVLRVPLPVDLTLRASPLRLPNTRTANREPRTANCEPRTANCELRTANCEPRTANREPRTANCELRTANREPRTANCEPRTANRELRTANRESRTANCEPRTANCDNEEVIFVLAPEPSLTLTPCRRNNQ
jgi:hypothetical protein